MAISSVIAVALIAPPAIVAITLHEAAHGLVARHFGDDTALLKGRVTLNPLKHIDLFGTILLPAVLVLLNTGFIFGYAKPVPVNPNALFHPKRDMVWVAAAGPAMNLVLAMLSILLIIPASRFGHPITRWLDPLLLNSVVINIMLAIVNIIPLPPLDGGKAAIGLLPKRLGLSLAKLNQFGFLIVIAVFIVLPMAGKTMGLDLNLFDFLVEPPLHYIVQLVHLVMPRR